MGICLGGYFGGWICWVYFVDGYGVWWILCLGMYC